MTALVVILAIILALFLVSLIRVGAVAEYHRGGFVLRIRVGPLRFAVWPGREKPGKARKKKPEKKKKAEPVLPEGVGGKLELVRQILPVVAQAAGEMKRRLRIDTLTLHLTWAASDPASAALGFGAANAAAGVLYGLLKENFDLRDADVGVSVDFQQTNPTVYVKAALSLTIGQGVSFGLRFGARLLSIWMNGRGQRSGHDKKKEAVTHE